MKVEVVETPAMHAIPLTSGASAPAADMVLVKSQETARVPERVADEFRSADRNADGYLVLMEVEERFPLIAKEFAKVDRDGDRRISLDEFAELQRLQSERRPLQK